MTTEREARSEAFLTLIYNLLAKHVDSYTPSANLLHLDAFASWEDAALGRVVMPDGNEYRIEVEWIKDVTA